MSTPLSCSFCGTSRLLVAALIASEPPEPRHICNACVERAFQHVRGVLAAPSGHAQRCAFCEKHDARAQYQAGGVAICDDCVEMCVDLLVERGKFERAPLPSARIVSSAATRRS